MEVSKDPTILDTLSCESHLSKHPQFLATKTQLLTTNICHLDPEFHDKVMINIGTGWSREE